MKSNYRVFDILVILTFTLGITLPLIFTRNQGVSSIEQRALTPFPPLSAELPVLAAFPRQFEAFFNDHFGFRDPLTQLYSFLSLQLRSSPSHQVVIGNAGFLFLADPNVPDRYEDYRNDRLLTPQELQQWKSSLEAKYFWLKEKGIDYLFVIVPEKQTIYDEYWPERITRVNARSRFDQLLAIMKDSPVPILDLRPVLRGAKPLGLLYQKTDTHWNYLGAAMAQFEIVQSLAVKHPEIVPIRYGPEDFVWVTTSGGDLAKMMNLQNILADSAPILKETLPACKTTPLWRDPRLAYPPGVVTPYERECPLNGSPTALIFHDSFFTMLQPYMSSYFAKATYVWLAPDLPTLERFVMENSPNVVIQEQAERLLKKVPLDPAEPLTERNAPKPGTINPFALTISSASSLSNIEVINGMETTGQVLSIKIDPNNHRTITITGWAVDAQANDLAAAVFINIDGRMDIPSFYGLERPDVADYFQNPRFRLSAFAAVFDSALLDDGDHIVSLKIVAQDRVHYYQSQRTVVLKVERQSPVPPQ